MQQKSKVFVRTFNVVSLNVNHSDSAGSPFDALDLEKNPAP